MGFGNPYGDEWNSDIVINWCELLYSKFDIKIQALSDTIGIATPASIDYLFKALIPSLPHVEFGAHLHTTPENAISIVESAYNAGCRRFDGAIKGFGGCPMASNELTGNMPTEIMLSWFDTNEIKTGINSKLFNKSLELALSIFPS